MFDVNSDEVTHTWPAALLPDAAEGVTMTVDVVPTAELPPATLEGKTVDVMVVAPCDEVGLHVNTHIRLCDVMMQHTVQKIELEKSAEHYSQPS